MPIGDESAGVEHVEPLRALEEAAEEPERSLGPECDHRDQGRDSGRLLQIREADHVRDEPREHESPMASETSPRIR